MCVFVDDGIFEDLHGTDENLAAVQSVLTTGMLQDINQTLALCHLASAQTDFN